MLETPWNTAIASHHQKSGARNWQSQFGISCDRLTHWWSTAANLSQSSRSKTVARRTSIPSKFMLGMVLNSGWQLQDGLPPRWVLWRQHRDGFDWMPMTFALSPSADP